MKLPIRWIISTITLMTLLAPLGPVAGEGASVPGSVLDRHLSGNQSALFTNDAYTVEVDCDFDDNDNRTECEFSAVASRDASDVLRLTVPAELVCADVLDGDDHPVRLEDGQRGYASDEDDDELDLEIEGRVTTTGTAVYWVATIGKVVPAEGPALRCHPASEVQPSPQVPSTVTTPGPTVEAVEEAQTPATSATDTSATSQENATGTLVVATFACTNVPEDTRTFDWFGECTPGAGPLGFNIDNVNDTRMGERAVGTDGNTGEAVFEDVPSGTYKLSSGRGEPAWCHATSDSVNEDGHVVIEGGAHVTVWAFYCEAAAS
jgi:hypothetical protein